MNSAKSLCQPCFPPFCPQHCNAALLVNLFKHLRSDPAHGADLGAGLRLKDLTADGASPFLHVVLPPFAAVLPVFLPTPIIRWDTGAYIIQYSVNMICCFYNMKGIFSLFVSGMVWV